MKELNDEELQRMFEDGRLSSQKPQNGDERAYSILFEALKKEPGDGLPYDFAAKITRNIKAQEKRTGELRYNLAAVAIFLTLIAVFFGIMTTNGDVSTSTILKYKWLLILLPIVFVAIQYFDQVLVKARIFKGKSNT